MTQTTFLRFTGSLPETLSTLDNLKQLVVDSCRLSGPFPTTVLGNMPGITHVSMFQNRFSGPLTNAISGATSLVELNLGQNDLEDTVPMAALASLTKLRQLILVPNPRLLLPDEDQVADLRQKLPRTNICVSWKNYA